MTISSRYCGLSPLRREISASLDGHYFTKQVREIKDDTSFNATDPKPMSHTKNTHHYHCADYDRVFSVDMRLI